MLPGCSYYYNVGTCCSSCYIVISCCLVVCSYCCCVLQAMQQAVADHEPEFDSLKRGVQELCHGPDAESAYHDKVANLDKEGCPVGRDLPRPGHKEQDDIIVDYDKRLETLKNKLATQSADLSTQLEKGKEFESVTSDLSGWLDEMEGRLDDFKIRDPKSGILKSQQQECQVSG